jgi:UPF0271 protein
MDIDLNADLGEGSPHDAELMTIVTSANVCCGLHAGSPAITRECLELARHHGVAVGAHPGYADREHYGRRELQLSTEEVWGWCAFQIGGLIGLASAEEVTVRYVKPHGALYNQAVQDGEVARAIILAAALFDLPVVGLPGSALEVDARGIVPFVAEGFADRRYRPDGSLVPRSEPDAFVHDPAEAVAQVDRLIRERGVRTLCVHGDNPDAVAFARAVREALLTRGFTLKAFT